jgi:hypothetical protein
MSSVSFQLSNSSGLTRGNLETPYWFSVNLFLWIQCHVRAQKIPSLFISQYRKSCYLFKQFFQRVELCFFLQVFLNLIHQVSICFNVQRLLPALKLFRAHQHSSGTAIFCNDNFFIS